jgi:hypothetical protein
MLFELHNDVTQRISHCGVLEFVAEEGMIIMPYWVRFKSRISLVLAAIFSHVFFLRRPVMFPKKHVSADLCMLSSCMYR